jgi:hypothetical protein
MKRRSGCWWIEGGDVNAQGGRYGNALQAAALKGDEAVVRLLVDRGADVNARAAATPTLSRRRYGRMMRRWSGCWWIEGPTLTPRATNTPRLSRRRHLTMTGRWSGGPAAGGSKSRHQRQGRQIQQRSPGGGIGGSRGDGPAAGGSRSHVNAQGGHYANALRAAALKGDEVVRLLVDRGADANAQDGNTLQAAASNGDEAVVQLLVDRGADVNAQGGYYGNALQAAVWKGDGALVRLLGGSRGRRQREGRPLRQRGGIGMVQLLVDREAKS